MIADVAPKLGVSGVHREGVSLGKGPGEVRNGHDMASHVMQSLSKGCGALMAESDKRVPEEA